MRRRRLQQPSNQELDLFNNGYDFLFIDDQSVIRSEIEDGRLNVSDQSFKILILPSMKALRWSTLTRALDFFHNGGIVIAVGSLPEASDNAGSLIRNWIKL